MEKLTKLIIENIGGKENIDKTWHCITRIRFNVKDDDKVNLKEIEKHPEVVGTRYQNGQHQIILGNKVGSVYKALEKELGDISEASNSSDSFKLSNIIDVISGTFNPILPAIIGTGLLKAILSLLVLISPDFVESGVYQVFDIISDAAFYFLPFLLANSASRVFKVDVSLTLVLAGVLMYPTITAAAGEQISFFGLPLPYLDYSSSVIPILLGILLLKYVDGFFRKIIPEMFSFVFIPMLSLLVTAPIMLIALAPIGNYISVYFADLVNWLFTNAAPLAGLVYVGLMPLIIMTGMHYAFFPTAIQSLQTIGFDLVLLPANLIHNSAQAGAAFAVGMKTKNSKIKSTAISTGVSAIFGITEPAMYGINLKYKKPFTAVMISGGIVGAVAVTLGLKAYAFAIPGILSIPGYAGGKTSNLVLAILSYIASFVIAFILTLVQKLDFETEVKESINSPVEGRIISLDEVNDSVFSDKVMGDGFAVQPSKDVFVSPIEGVVAMIYKTKHAIMIQGESGLEIMIHIGLDTVNLEGKYFTTLVEEGQSVKVGDPLVKIDKDSMEKEGYDLTTPVIITNSNDYQNINLEIKSEEVTPNTKILSVERAK